MKQLLFVFCLVLGFSLNAQIQLDRDVLGASLKVKIFLEAIYKMSYTIGEPFTLTLENSLYWVHTLGFRGRTISDSKPYPELTEVTDPAFCHSWWAFTKWRRGTMTLGTFKDDDKITPDALVTVFDRWGQKVYSGTSQEPSLGRNDQRS